MRRGSTLTTFGTQLAGAIRQVGARTYAKTGTDSQKPGQIYFPTRRVAYQDFLHEAIPEGEWALIRESLQRGQLMSSQRFVDEVARIAGRFWATGPRGRGY